MEIEAAREYYTLSEEHKRISTKRKQLQATLDILQGREKRARNMELTMALNIAKKTEVSIGESFTRLKEKYSHSVPPIEHYLKNLKEQITSDEEQYVTFSQMAQQINGSIFLSSLLSKIQLSLDQLRLEYSLLPRARSLFAIPASTLPLALHPNRANLCLMAGELDGDLWHHIFSFFSVDDRATLRALRVSCIVFAILVHSMQPEITGVFFCV